MFHFIGPRVESPSQARVQALWVSWIGCNSCTAPPRESSAAARCCPTAARTADSPHPPRSDTSFILLRKQTLKPVFPRQDQGLRPGAFELWVHCIQLVQPHLRAHGLYLHGLLPGLGLALLTTFFCSKKYQSKQKRIDDAASMVHETTLTPGSARNPAWVVVCSASTAAATSDGR